MAEILSLWLYRTLVPVIAGTLHPNPIIRGKNECPDKPKNLMILFAMTADLAMYPLSSKMDKNIYMVAIIGINDVTVWIAPPNP